MSSLGMAQKGALLPDSLKDATVLKLSEWIHNSTHNELYYTPSLAQLKIEYVAESLDKTLKNTANRYHKFYYKSANGYYYIGDIEIKSALEPNIFGTTDTTTAEINKSISIKTLNKRPKQKIILGTRKQGIGQNAFVIKGKITESNSNKAVIGATIMVNETEKGTITNEAGEFSIKLKKGSYTLSIRSIDMEPLDVSVTVYSKDELRLQMFKKLVELNEVVISSEAKSNVNRIEIMAGLQAFNPFNIIKK
ncbi:MAG: carboxypeptidase-like regulatory domain-containing protein [Bacteroidia bacterium]